MLVRGLTNGVRAMISKGVAAAIVFDGGSDNGWRQQGGGELPFVFQCFWFCEEKQEKYRR